jgi:acetolactate synthase-1/2/3 large subunit
MVDVTDCASVPAGPLSVPEAVVDILWQVGVRRVYVECGREIAPTWSAVLASQDGSRPILSRHTRHENGAGYACVGASAVSGEPVAMLVTTAPGQTNAMTSLETARAAGARLILVSARHAGNARGRLGIQGTSDQDIRDSDLDAAGRLFDLVERIECADDLVNLAGHLGALAATGDPFLAHISIPTSLAVADVPARIAVPHVRVSRGVVGAGLADELVDIVAREPFDVVVGWGARHAAPEVRELLDLTGARLMCTPRGKGIGDLHPQFIGGIGNGGHATARREFLADPPRLLIALGTDLGEDETAWQPWIVPAGGLIHVARDARLFGRSYVEARTWGIQADVKDLLTAILDRRDRLVRREPRRVGPFPPSMTLSDDRHVHPAALMAVYQRVVIEEYRGWTAVDAASAMFWGLHHLKLDDPGLWFVEGRFGAIGNSNAVLGAADVLGRPAFAIIGDAALHMQDEINTAVAYDIPAVWVVLNDSGPGICRHGMDAEGWRHEADFPSTNFAAVAAAKGAHGIRVEVESALERSLREAIANAPCVVDVVIDSEIRPPIGARVPRWEDH